MSSSSSKGFRHFMDCLGFVDLGFSGRNFTWNNGRSGLACICKRLDRSITNIQWCTGFPNVGVKHYSVSISDHVPLILNLYGDGVSVVRSFKFKKFWTWEELLWAGCRHLETTKGWVSCVGSFFKNSGYKECS